MSGNTSADRPGLRSGAVEDRREWNAAVETFGAAEIRQGWEWGELRREAGWTPYRLAVLTRERCIAACAISARSLRGLGSLLYAPRGPLLDPDEPEALGHLVDALRPLARRLGTVVLRTSPPVGEGDALCAALARHGFRAIVDEFTTWNTPRFSQRLHLDAPEEELWRQVRRRYRDYIRAGPRRGIVIEASDDEADLEAFYRLLVNVAALKRYPIRGLDYYRALFRQYRAAGTLTFLVARVGGGVAGGLLAVRLGRRSTMLYTSVRGELADTARHHVAPAMYWEYIRRCKREGVAVADFGPSGVSLVPQQTDKGWGVYRFKIGFGCGVETYARYRDLVFRPAAYRLFRLCERRALPLLWRLRALEGTAKRRVAAIRRAPRPVVAGAGP